jgi:hypothetical protein
MNITEEKGYLTINLGYKIMRFANCRIDVKLGIYVSALSEVGLCHFKTFMNKTEASKYAKSIGYTSAHVFKIGSRFARVWGIRHDLRDSYFLMRDE